MHHLLLFVRQHANWFLFLLLQSICVLLIAYESAYHQTALLNTGMELSGRGLTVYRRAIGYLRLGEENRRLAAENSQLLNRLAQTAAQSDSVYSDTTQKQIYFYSAARVIQSMTASGNNYLMLDQGSLAGIEPRMGVIGPDGVVGIVRNVSPHFAAVYSLLHSKVTVSARIGHSGARGTVRWDGLSPQYVQLDEIPRQQRVLRGDTVFTSGLSRIFPDRIPVGIVESYQLPEGSNHYRIRVRLTTQYNRLDHVYVIRNLLRREMDTLMHQLIHDQ